MRNPFRYFNSSPEVIRLVVMMYVRYLAQCGPSDNADGTTRRLGADVSNRYL